MRLPGRRKRRAILVLFMDGFSPRAVGRLLQVPLAVVYQVMRKGWRGL